MPSSKVLITISLLAIISYGSSSHSKQISQESNWISSGRAKHSTEKVSESLRLQTMHQTSAPATADERPADLPARGQKNNRQTEKSDTTETKPEPDDRELGVGQTDLA